MKAALLISILFFSFGGFGQTKDAELWTGLALRADFNKKWSIKYETQGRFYKNASTLKTYYNEVSTKYEVIKNLNLGLSYRYSRKNKETHYTGQNRLCFNVDYGIKIAKTGLKFKTRARYQYGFDRLSVINDVIYPEIGSTFRWKFDLKYSIKDFKRISPFVGTEIFKGIQPAESVGLDAYRIYAGLDFDLPARHELNIKYIFESEQSAVPFSSHIYAIQYTYALSSKIFKKKKKLDD